MELQKVVFSSSEQFAPFWNIQSQIWKEVLGIEPVLLLWGEMRNTNVSDKFGEVIERKFDPNFPKVLQITMSKFWHTQTDPESIWMIGDIDLIPLRKKYYTELSLPSFGDWYAHLSAECGIHTKMFHSPWRPTKTGGNARLIGNGHIAKGDVYRKLFFDGVSFEEVLNHIIKSNLYGNRTHGFQNDDHGYYWCAEEDYTTRLLNRACRSRDITLYLKNPNDHGLRLNRSAVESVLTNNQKTISYRYDSQLLLQEKYIDIHCHRPFHEQEDSLKTILKLAGMIH